MGSFAASVALPERLRIWRHFGVELLYVPGGIVPCNAALTETVGVACPAPEAPSGTRGFDAGTWPDPWRKLAARVRTSPRVVFTYPELSQDVSGQGDASRRKLFLDVLAYAGWAPGTTLFWPFVGPDGRRGGRGAELFLQGLWHFGIAHVVVFGPELAKSVSDAVETAEFDTAPTVSSLPDTSALVGLLPHELHRRVSVVKTLRL